MKWYKESEKDIMDKCPFCYDAEDNCKMNDDCCEFCYCPRSICAKHGRVGFVREIMKKYNLDFCSTIQVKDLNYDDLLHMQDLLKEHMNEKDLESINHVH